MNTLFLPPTGLARLAGEYIAAGVTVIAPARRPAGRGTRIEYRPIASPGELACGEGLPAFSLKEFFSPPTQVLFRYRLDSKQVHIEDPPARAAPRVIIGAPPCDAAALPIVDRVMDWEYHDERWFELREATTIVGLACTRADENCFCTAVGLGPDHPRGSDILLIPSAGGHLAQVHTPKGEALVQAHRSAFEEVRGQVPSEDLELTRERVASDLSSDPSAVRRFLEQHFEHRLWNELGLRCHGCGTCAFVCPVCHCFDIVDEPEGIDHGVRRRNWDTCQSSRFTLHASGHNPRPDQNCRIRQRLMHKFFIYPDRFQEILCTGCGRCSRACPAGMDLPEILGQLTALAGG